MPLLLAVGVGILVGVLVAGGGKRWSAGAAVPATLPPRDPTVGGKGEAIFSLPQERWGVVQSLAHTPRGYVLGVRFRNGLAVVLHESEVVR